MKVYPWVTAYNLALERSNYCVFATARTPEREKKFKWISPLIVNRSILVTTQSSKLKINSLTETKNYSIGVQDEDAGADKLKSLGFKNLVYSSSIDISIGKLYSGETDMVALAESVYIDLIQKGINLKKLMDILELEMGLACNHKTSPDLILKMQESLIKHCSK